LLSKLKFFVDSKGRKLLFSAQCLSHINYASTVWCGAGETHIKKINALHRRGCKLIINSSYLCTADKLKAVNILPLQQQLVFNMSMLMYKVVHGLSPSYLNEFLTKAPDRYASNKYLLPRTRIDLYKTSFAFAGPSVWNSLPQIVKANRSAVTFKASLRKHLFTQVTNNNQSHTQP
jgi:hypothetical protein